MPSFKDRIKAFGKRSKPPAQTKPDSKGFVGTAKKIFHWVFSCVKRQKDKDDCPGLPEVQISYADKEVAESLASRSRISLTDSESDICPAEADLVSMSDSLEGIPELHMADSLPSLMEHEEEKEATGKGKDGEKDLGSHDPSLPAPASALDGLTQPQVTDAEEAILETLSAEGLSSSTESEAGPCPAEADPGSTSGRDSESQGRSTDHSVRKSDLNDPNYILTEEDLHLMCEMFPTYSKETKRSLTDGIASKFLDLMVEHFLKSTETACDDLMYGVLASPMCDLNTCINEFTVKLNETQMQDDEELPLAKLKALRGIRLIIKDHSSNQELNDWLQFHFVTMAHILANQFQSKEPGTSRKVKKYIVPGEAIDIFMILLLRLDLVRNMKSKLCTR